MSKYIVELFDGVQVLTGVGASPSGTVWSKSYDVDELEELNSDYINEHFGELQDEAYQRGHDDGYEAGCATAFKPVSDAEYQRGFEDGKWKAEDGCDGCKYYEDTSLTNPCSECSRGCVDHYKPASDPDRIEVGDEVIDKDGDTTIVTNIHERLFDGLCSDGSTMSDLFLEDVRKTGRHYDHIDKLLEAIRA